MKRGYRAVGFCLLAGFLAGSPSARAQEEGAPPPVVTEKLAEGLHEIRAASVNLLALTGSDGTLLIDAGYAETAEAVRDEIGKLGALPVRWLVDTHWHFDHVGGNALLGKEAAILAHASVRALLSADQEILGNHVEALPERARPNITFDGGVTLHLNGEEVVLTALPGGHTGGDVTVLLRRANVLHIGDILFADRFPFVDVDHGGSALGVADNIRAILDTAPEGAVFVPGHGRRLAAADLEAYREMVLATVNLVRNAQAEGWTVEEMREADLLSDYAAWDGSFTRSDWIGFVARSLLLEPAPDRAN